MPPTMAAYPPLLYCIAIENFPWHCGGLCRIHSVYCIQIDRVLDAYFCRIKYSSVCINILAVQVYTKFCRVYQNCTTHVFFLLQINLVNVIVLILLRLVQNSV